MTSLNNDEIELKKKWMKTGGICGLAGIIAYFGAAFLPVPDKIAYSLAFAFGPMLAIGLAGLYHGLTTRDTGPMRQVAVVFGIGAGFTVLAMLCVQQAIFFSMSSIADGAEKKNLASVVNMVHLGLDVAWDVLISVAVTLFGAAMMKNRAFGKIAGAIGVFLGVCLLGFNLYYFPIPPVDSNSIDWGPFVALWLISAFVLLLLAPRRSYVANVEESAAI